jgi:hypothetical protein
MDILIVIRYGNCMYVFFNIQKSSDSIRIIKLKIYNIFFLLYNILTKKSKKNIYYI